MKKLVIIVKNESILNTFSSSMPLNYLHESHGVSKGIVLKRPSYWKNDIFVQKLLIWKLFLEFFENLVKRDFLFRIWIIDNLVCVKTCYSFENVKSLPMIKKPKFHDHEPLKSFLIDGLRAFWSTKQNHLEPDYISLSHNLFFWQIWYEQPWIKGKPFQCVLL